MMLFNTVKIVLEGLPCAYTCEQLKQDVTAEVALLYVVLQHPLVIHQMNRSI